MSFYRSSFQTRMSFLGATLSNIHIPSIGGIKKQISKVWASHLFSLEFSKVLISFMLQADQLVSEKVSGAEHTKLDENFVHMEKITDVFLEVEVSFCFCTIFNIYLTSRFCFCNQPEKWVVIQKWHFLGWDVWKNSGLLVSKPSGQGQTSLGQGNRLHRSEYLIMWFISTKLSNFSALDNLIYSIFQHS